MTTVVRVLILILGIRFLTGGQARASYTDSVSSFVQTPPAFTAVNNTAHTAPATSIRDLESRALAHPGDGNALFQLGKAYLAADRYDNAVATLQKAVSLDPAHAEAWEYLGISLYFKHRKVEAISALQKAAKLGASNPDLWNDLGIALLDEGRLPEASDAIAQGFKLTSRYVKLWNSKGMLLEKQGKTKEAVAAFRQAVALDPKYAIGWLNIGLAQAVIDPGKEMASFQKAVDADPRLGAAWENATQSLLNQRKYKEAGVTATQMTTLLPDDPKAWILEAEVAKRLQQWERLVEAYHQAIDVLGLKGWDPRDAHDNAVAYAEYGNGCSHIGHHADAEILIRKALAIDPSSTDALTSLAFLRALQQRWQEAELAALKSLDLDPKQPVAWTDLGLIYRLGLGNPDDAVKSFQKAIDLLPTYSGAWEGLGEARQALHDNAAAATAYRKAVELDPDFVVAWRGLATTTSDPQEARQAVARAISLHPWDPALYSVQSALCSLSQDWSGSEEALYKSLSFNEDNPANWSLLGGALLHLGRFAEAAFAYQKAIVYGNDLPDRKEAAHWACLAEACIFLAHADHNDAHWQAALDANDAATDLDPSNSATWYQAFLCNLALNRWDDVVATVKKWRETGSLIPGMNGITIPAPQETPAPSGYPATRATQSDEGRMIRTLLQQNRSAEALAFAQAAIKDHPDDPVACLYMGDVLMNAGRRDDAIDYLKKAVKLEPKMGPAWYDLGACYAGIGLLHEAVDALTQAVDYMPELPNAWETLVKCCNAGHDVAGGLERINDLLQRHPCCASAWTALGDLQLDQNTPQDAVPPLRKAVSLQPGYGHGWNSLGLAFIRSNQPTAALNCFELAVTTSTANPEPWNNLGYTLFLAGQTDKAINDYLRALTYNPKHARALYNLTTAYAAQKKWDLARQTCDQLAAVNPAQASQLRAKLPDPGSPAK